ncbi:hypothetical protein CASFOL_004605 [Castilleja foliolosa]|uniref:Ubiquitin-like protease family profile domain-containing protein n=1 Tax=Castilleja foliolosa TaxID=1961234 RepID=A0ABD3EB76_9LAMI
MASLQEEHLNRLRYEALRKRPAQPSIPGNVDVEEQPKKKRGRPKAALPSKRSSASKSGPMEVKGGNKKRRQAARKAQAKPPAMQTEASTADAIPESTTSTGLLMLEAPPTQMPESTSVPEWTWILLALLGREVTVSGAAECERWYRFGGRNNRFGKVEYAAITGLRFGASDFNPDSSDHLPYENGVYRLHFDGTAVYGDHLLEKFEESFFTEPEEAVKVALVLFAHFFFFAADGRTTIPLWLWTLVEREEQFADFPWGSYTFQRLSHYLTAIHPPNPDKSDYQPNIYAYLMPLQLWAYETIPIFAQEGGMKTGDNGIPRAVRWKCPKNNWNRIDELDRDDLMITTMEVTEEEMAAPYMRAIEIQISEGVQYIHRETWISSCHPLEKSAVTVQLKGRSKKRPSKSSKCKGDPTPGEGEGSGERVGTAHGVGTSGDDPSPSVVGSINRAVSSAISHALPGALREALDLTLPVILPAIVERAIQSVLPGILSDAVRQAVDLAIPGAVEQAVELFRRHEDKGFPDVDERAGERTDPFIREEPAGVNDDEEPTENVQDKAMPDVDEQEYEGTDPFIHEEPAGKRLLGTKNSFWDPRHGFWDPRNCFLGQVTVSGDKKQYLGKKPASKKQFVGEIFNYRVDGDKELTENVGNVGLVTPKETRPKRLKSVSRFRMTPFVDCMNENRRKGVKAMFTKWKLQVDANRRDVGFDPKFYVGPDYFMEIEKTRTHLSTTHINAYLAVLWRRLESGVRLCPGGHLVKAWNTLLPRDVECATVEYAQWEVPTILIKYVEGSLPRWGQPWSTVSNVVLVCNVEQHWVVCLLRIDAWEIILFDSLPSPDRVRQLEPLSLLIPYVLAKARYFDAKSVVPRFDRMPVVPSRTDDELVQGDVHSCGVFACMYIERMIARDFAQSSSISDVAEYRQKMALEIFAHSE